MSEKIIVFALYLALLVSGIILSVTSVMYRDGAFIMIALGATGTTLLAFEREEKKKGSE